MKRWPNLDFEAVRTANRKQAMVPEGARVIAPAGTAPGLVVPPLDGAGPTVVVLPGPPRELHAMWEAGGRVRGVPVGHRRAHRLRAADAAAVRHPGVRDRRDPAGGRGRAGRPLPARDHHLPAAGRGGGGDPLRARRRGPVLPAGRAGVDAARRHAVLRGRQLGGRPGGRPARRPPPRAGRVVHRRADGGAADRAGGLVGLRGGRRGHLRGRGQGRAARRGSRR